jgi:hypothetical protein
VTFWNSRTLIHGLLRLLLYGTLGGLVEVCHADRGEDDAIVARCNHYGAEMSLNRRG